MHEVACLRTNERSDARPAQDSNIKTEFEGQGCFGVIPALSEGFWLWLILKRSFQWLTHVGSPMVSLGFAVRAIKYTRWVESIIAKEIDGGVAKLDSFVVTGHSLGGAVAQGFAMWFAQKYSDVKLSVYTFEGAKLGNATHRAAYRERVPYSFAHTFDMDVFPLLAPWFAESYTWKMTWLLKERIQVLGCNPIHWIAYLHLRSAVVFVPWMEAAFPGVYKSVWENNFKDATIYSQGQLKSASEVCGPEYVPGSTQDLPLSAFKSVWAYQRLPGEEGVWERVSHWPRSIVTFCMQLLVSLIFIQLVAILFLPPTWSAISALASGVNALFSDPLFSAAFDRLLAMVGIVPVAGVLILVIEYCLPPPAEVGGQVESDHSA